MPDDDFRYVKSKKRSRRNKYSSCKLQDKLENNSCTVSKEAALRKILLARKEVDACDFYLSVLKTLNKGLGQLGNLQVEEIICYGLGHFAECVVARYQFGLLLALKDKFSASVLVHDPIFNPTELDILKELDCEVITVNEEGKHKIKCDTVTLIYLPHCPKQLTNNFLWTNWGPELKNCIIFGNSFSKIIESHPKRSLNTSASYILNIVPYTEELNISNSFRYTDIFNDIAVHIFPQSKINCVPHSLWTICDEPKYSVTDTEFITKQIISALQLQN